MTQNDSQRLRQAMAIIEKLESELSTLKQQSSPDSSDFGVTSSSHEPIAIIGMNLCLPTLQTPEELWSLLLESKSLVTGIPSQRSELVKLQQFIQSKTSDQTLFKGGFLEDLTLFPTERTGILPNELSGMTPSQRLLLRSVFQLMEHTGITEQKRKSNLIGVFLGLAGETVALPFNSDASSGSFNTGSSLVAGRISYALGLEGPSFSVDTACSSALVALHLACQSIRNNECDMALVGGAFAQTNLFYHIVFHKLGLLSSTGECNPFDENANGFIPTEGCAMIALQPLSKAIQQGHKIFSVIRGSSVRNTGSSLGFSAPNRASQEALVKTALEAANVNPEDIQYVETHGSGTPLGDSIEFHALDSILRHQHQSLTPCYLGAVKSNIGHTMQASGLFGVIKATLCMQHHCIPPQPLFQNPSPAIQWDSSPLQIPTELIEWKSNRSRLCGVSSNGLSGTGAHVILEEAPKRAPHRRLAGSSSNFFLCAPSKELLIESANHLLEKKEELSQLDFHNLCYSFNTGKERGPHGLYMEAHSFEDLFDSLKRFQEHTFQHPDFAHVRKSPRKQKIAFFFTDCLSPLPGKAFGELQAEPEFKVKFEQCNVLFQQKFHRMFDCESISSRASQIIEQWSAQFAFSHMLLSWGIRPRVVGGMGTGEIIAACFANLFSLPDAIDLTLLNLSHIFDSNSQSSMLRVDSLGKDLDDFLEDCPDSLDCVFIDPLDRFYLYGPSKELLSMKAQWRDHNFIVSDSMYSSVPSQVSTPLFISSVQQQLNRMEFHTPTIHFVSSRDGSVSASRISEASYWLEQIQQNHSPMSGLEEFPHLKLSHVLVFATLKTAEDTLFSSTNDLRSACHCLFPEEHLSDTVTPLIQSLCKAGIRLTEHAFGLFQNLSLENVPLMPQAEQSISFTKNDSIFGGGSSPSFLDPNLIQQIKPVLNALSNPEPMLEESNLSTLRELLAKSQSFFQELNKQAESFIAQQPEVHSTQGKLSSLVISEFHFRDGIDITYPQTPIEHQLVLGLESILKIKPVGTQEDFFELGGNSLHAQSYTDLINSRILATAPGDRRITANDIYTYPRIKELASWMASENWRLPQKNLVPIQQGGEENPVFCIHGADGGVYYFHSLSPHLGGRIPQYAIQSTGLDGLEPPETDIPTIARLYLKKIQAIQPHGPYRILAYCFGCHIGVELLSQLGEDAEGSKIFLLAPPFPVDDPQYIERMVGALTREENKGFFQWIRSSILQTFYHQMHRFLRQRSLKKYDYVKRFSPIRTELEKLHGTSEGEAVARALIATLTPFLPPAMQQKLSMTAASPNTPVVLNSVIQSQLNKMLNSIQSSIPNNLLLSMTMILENFFYDNEVIDSHLIQSLLVQRFYYSIAKWIPQDLHFFEPSGFSGNVRGHEMINKTNLLFYTPPKTSVSTTLILTRESSPQLAEEWSHFTIPSLLNVHSLECAHDMVFKDANARKLVDIVLERTN